MKEAVLSGIERAAILSPKAYRFFGIESPELYEQGGKSFVETEHLARTILPKLDRALLGNRARRKEHFNEALLRFDDLASQFEAKNDLVSLVSLIANEARNLHIDRWKYAEIEKFIDPILLGFEIP